ncbi:hypothetical protein L4D76_21380 [Photobacterium sagamiensis]|uniref:hypothetical protein n=1 Tax=Photobacterium sagamiensis TaxID=2910241 RepID=UPI003D0D864B
MGNDIEDRNIAFWSRISDKVMPYEDQTKFYDRRTELLQLRDELKASFGADRNKLYQSHQSELGLLPLLKGTEKQLKVLRKRRDAIYQSSTTTAEKDLRIKGMERQMKKVIDKFNQRYDQLTN